MKICCRSFRAAWVLSLAAAPPDVNCCICCGSMRSVDDHHRRPLGALAAGDPALCRQYAADAGRFAWLNRLRRSADYGIVRVALDMDEAQGGEHE
jgi:hypothetical protein